MFLTIKEAVNTYKNGCKGKCETTTGILLGKSFFAGIMIGLGAAGSSVAAHNIGNVGLARLVAATVFPVGLMMVILMGAELFTGDCLLAIGLPESDITPLQFVKTLVYVYLGNLIGGIVLSFLVVLSGQLDYSGGLLGAYTIKVALSKVGLSPVKAISSGVLCNILVCAAVIMAVCAKDITGKLLVSFFVIMLFVTAGYEHCVANMYYITAGIMAKMNPSYVQIATDQYGITASQIALLNIKSMVVNNLIPVTIGNIIGGSCFIGLPFYYFNKNKSESKEEVKSSKIIEEDGSNDVLHRGYVKGIAR
ncbi:MAG: formate/nitrite transporter family protein [Lachnospiraceae bacterium]|nr:formate/nitrite transporter family protein [Lachnospiraceae bacterium]